jgi:hypothetical protein
MKQIIIIITLLILLTLIFTNIKHESFVTPYLIYDIKTNPNMLNITYDFWNYSHEVDQLKRYKNTSLNDDKFDSNLYLTDVYTCIQNKYNVLTIINDKKIAIFYRQKSHQKNMDISKINSIGYYNDLDIDIIKIIYNVSNIKIPPLKKIKYSSINFKEVDSIFVFTPITNLLNITEDIDVFTYNLDIHKIKVYLPYCKIDNIDLTIYYPLKYKSEFPVKSYLSIDMLLCGYEILEFNKEYERILNNYNTYDKINYYTMFLDFFDITMNNLDVFNKHVIDISTLPILEQFIPNKNLIGYYDSYKQELLIKNNKINGIPFKNNDEIILEQQDREEENGNYIFIEPNILRKKIKSILKKDDFFDPRYECYEHPSYQTQGLCESPYDEIGQYRKPVYKWDRRCETNIECPYYQKNTNYQNYRGGCVDGYCEMPIGMSNNSYRTGVGIPYCYNCIDPMSTLCCDEQMHPDYAFELDVYERKAYKDKLTIIS